jgi:hypothetical protein
MTTILDLPGVIVEDYKQIGATLIFVVKSKQKTSKCLYAINLAIIYIKIIGI